jgi:hypothetical protein
MKHIAYIITLAVALLATACTENNGDIGDFFGTWRVESYTADGVVQQGNDMYKVNATTFSFQSQVVMVNVVLDEYGTNHTWYGSWSESGDVLTLNFTHSDNEIEQGTSSYAAPVWLGMTSDSPMNLSITNRDSRSMTLSWTDGHGIEKIYKISKTW